MYVVEKQADDLFGAWHPVARFDAWDDAYADLMSRRDAGETVRVSDESRLAGGPAAADSLRTIRA